ncbi:MAG: DNA-binding transcriptional activator DcuR [Deltaproteobacteria bacterium ADurb.Bin510]|nr:MAG: DNA-binding transcriptional activator DcuR [Deltaproteobacteria bacterium ADurb.Bin510]
MADGLDVIIVDDELNVCEILAANIRKFYSWGEVLVFNDLHEAVRYCRNQDSGLAIFILDVFVANENGFAFLDAIEDNFPSCREDCIMITGNANDNVVDMCVASGVNHLLEKPVKPYALQLAVRSIVNKYLNFAKRLLDDPAFAEAVARF